MSDVAFLVMDLATAAGPTYAARFLTAYLETTGDYDGLAVLRFYIVYRALVRAKIALPPACPGDRCRGAGELVGITAPT